MNKLIEDWDIIIGLIFLLFLIGLWSILKDPTGITIISKIFSILWRF